MAMEPKQTQFPMHAWSLSTTDKEWLDRQFYPSEILHPGWYQGGKDTMYVSENNGLWTVFMWHSTDVREQLATCLDAPVYHVNLRHGEETN